LIRDYIRQIWVIALRTSWTAANGLPGAGLGGVALIWPGVQNFFSTKSHLAIALNWLLSFIIYAIVAWIVLFLFQLVISAPYQLWKRERNERPNDQASDPARDLGVVEHDRKLAARMREIFPEASEGKLVSDLLGQHAYWDTQGDKLNDAIYFLGSVEAHFLIDELRNLADEFVKSGADLLEFMGLKFFVYPKGRIERPLYFAMQPSWNLDREGNGSDEQVRKYDLLAREVESHVAEFSRSYEDLIRAFHRALLE
jgi:hypothetical protein